jgi:hypothetical protein
MAGERGDRPITHTEQERGHIVAKLTKVRTTFTPGEVIKIDSTELLDLERQGFIHSREGDDNWRDDKPVDIDSGVITDGLAEQATKGDKPAAAKAKAPASANTETKGA